MKRKVGIFFLAALFCALLIKIGRAQDDAEAVKAKLIKTYANLKTYQSSTHFELRQLPKAGGWLDTQSCEEHLAFDRAAGKFVYTRPDMQIFDDGIKLRAKIDVLADRYLEVPTPKPLTYQGVSDQVSMAFRQPAIQLALLLSPDPLKAIHGAEITSMKVLPPDPADALKRPGLESTSALGKLTLRMDPASGLVTSAIWEINMPGSPPGAYVAMHYDMQINQVDQPLAADQFTFDTTGRKPFATVGDWTAQGDESGGPAAVAGAPQAGDAPPPLEGHPAPPLALKNLDGKAYNLAKDKSAVVVLDFWATWCGPCVEWLPHVEHIQAWYRQENKPVAIYAVDEQEAPEVVRAFVAQNHLTAPVLMDSDGAAGKAYLNAAGGIPETVIIAHGRVVHVHLGLDPNGEAKIIQEVNELLAAPATQPAVK